MHILSVCSFLWFNYILTGRIVHLSPGMTIHVLVSSGLVLGFLFFPLACSLPSHFMLRFLMPSTNCNVQGTTANLPNVFHQTRCKEKKNISEGSQDTFTCQATNVKALRGSRGCKLWGLIHNHSAAKTFSTDASGQHICQYEGF